MAIVPVTMPRTFATLYLALAVGSLAACSSSDRDATPTATGAPASGPSAPTPTAPASPTLPDTSVGELLARLPAAADTTLDRERAADFVALSLHCVDKEYPNKTGDVAIDDASVQPPRVLHPSFFGCYDWHSAVHGHWAMLRILALFPDVEHAPAIRAVLDHHLTADKLAGEVAYFTAPHHKTFERPYGWGWFFRLRQALHQGRTDPDHARWLAATEPLAELLRQRLIDYLDHLTVPIRVGTHANTAYALVHIHDYARTVGDRELLTHIARHARRFYEADRQCPTAYEPSGEDFISPCLVEADLLRRVLPADDFGRWLNGFLPPLGSPAFAPLRQPTEVRDLEDPRIGHLIGLAFQRAASFDGIASALPGDDHRRALFERLAVNHRSAGIAQMFASGYGGAHWLASFAIYTLTDVGVNGR